MLLAACANRNPDLHLLYANTGSGRPHPPVIVIHGLFGSTMERDGKQIWPGDWSRFLTGSDFPELALPIDAQTLMPADDGTRPKGLFDKVVGVDFYRRIRETLRKAGGYQFTEPGTRVGDPSVRRQYVFLYDWRQDFANSAARLDRFVEQIRADYGDAGLRVDVVAHSMGGLLVRYFSLFGGEDVLSAAADVSGITPTYAGAGKVRKAILIGTPNLGSLSALRGVLLGYRMGVHRMPTEVAMTMPVAYQLLPHPDREWMISAEGERSELDLYDLATWRHFAWGPFDPALRERVREGSSEAGAGEDRLALLTRYFEHQLARAREFHHAISLPGRTRYILFGGDCELTPRRCLVEQVDGVWQVRLDPRNIVQRRDGVDYERLMLEPGDGSVSRTSLLARSATNPHALVRADDALEVAYSIFLCERHLMLTGNTHFQNNLLNILLLQETTDDRRNPAKPASGAR